MVSNSKWVDKLPVESEGQELWNKKPKVKRKKLKEFIENLLKSYAERLAKAQEEIERLKYEILY